MGWLFPTTYVSLNLSSNSQSIQHTQRERDWCVKCNFFHKLTKAGAVRGRSSFFKNDRYHSDGCCCCCWWWCLWHSADRNLSRPLLLLTLSSFPGSQGSRSKQRQWRQSTYCTTFGWTGFFVASSNAHAQSTSHSLAVTMLRWKDNFHFLISKLIGNFDELPPSHSQPHNYSSRRFFM